MSTPSTSLSHNDVLELLPEYCNGTLPHDLRQQVTEYLQHSPDTKAEAEAMRLMFDAIAEPEGNFDGDAAWQRAQARIEQAPRPGWHLAAQLRDWLAGLTAPGGGGLRYAGMCAGLTLALGLVWLNQPTDQRGSYDVLSAPASVSAELRVQLRLPAATDLGAVQAHFQHLPLVVEAVGAGAFELRFAAEPTVAELDGVLAHARTLNGLVSAGVVAAEQQAP